MGRIVHVYEVPTTYIVYKEPLNNQSNYDIL